MPLNTTAIAWIIPVASGILGINIAKPRSKTLRLFAFSALPGRSFVYSVLACSWSGLAALRAWRVQTHRARVSADMRCGGLLPAASARALRILALQANPVLFVLVSVSRCTESCPRSLLLAVLAQHGSHCLVVLGGFQGSAGFAYSRVSLVRLFECEQSLPIKSSIRQLLSTITALIYAFL